ncbi:hypothetical protein Dimus_004710 [Dionaea muscipula]
MQIQRRKPMASAMAMAILLFLMEVFGTAVGLTTTTTSTDCRQQVLSWRDVPQRQLLQKPGVESEDFMINPIEKELRPPWRRLLKALRTGPKIGPPPPYAHPGSHN